MRFSYAETFTDPGYYPALAQAAEEAGYASFVVPDSILYPEFSDTKYPYTEDGNREFLEDKPIMEPFTLIPALAAVTERIRFTTFVVKLPVRQPVLVAKQAASIAVMSDNRLSLGVGLSPWPEDYTATGTEWRRRGKRMDEMIEIVRGLTDGGYHEYHGEFYDVPSIKLCPVPSKQLPILVGGHADAALRRAARLGNGWMHGGGPDDFDALLAKVHDYRSQFGRDGEAFEVHAISMDAFTVDGVRRLEEAGVTDAIVGFRWPYVKGPDTQSLQEKIDALRGFADAVIHKL